MCSSKRMSFAVSRNGPQNSSALTSRARLSSAGVVTRSEMISCAAAGGAAVANRTAAVATATRRD
eukprot:CAMPEP_0172847084 /NCGR_PEP_ID=MMETSP1075-20121228/39739_1 /TAXON_ID=2916 /ORGANISM="Ceratium fusus, Strain PA161109" /LENGTH=64 /DNA_ID=CAMNT_0013692035 /DNA_START=53 /DNA_END=244 /DNA_ORIENTATION=+